MMVVVYCLNMKRKLKNYWKNRKKEIDNMELMTILPQIPVSEIADKLQDRKGYYSNTNNKSYNEY